LSASDADDGAADLTFDVTAGPDNGTLTVGGSEASSFTQADLEAGDVAYSHDGSETTSGTERSEVRGDSNETTEPSSTAAPGSNAGSAGCSIRRTWSANQSGMSLRARSNSSSREVSARYVAP
ncbi:hypothetical protein BRD08_11265, partial [Halobacteriales archaeon SW_10_66_29]